MSAGGKREGAGRKSKSEEYKLVERLDSLIEPSFAIEKMYEHITNGSEKMLELYMGYRFGKPTQLHDHKNDGGKFDNKPLIIIKEQGK